MENKNKEFRSVFKSFNEGLTISNQIIDLIKNNTNWLGYFIIHAMMNIANKITQDKINSNEIKFEE
jgi:hypothetical protein